MWPSTYSFGYNSMDVGPKLDIVGELEKAFRLETPEVHFGLYYCLWEFDNPIWLNDLSNNKTTRYFNQAPISLMFVELNICFYISCYITHHLYK